MSSRVVTSSTAGLKGYGYASAYAAAKHGVVGMVRSAALEMARGGVTVNALCPGFLDTEMTDRSVANIAAKTGRSAGEARAGLERPVVHALRHLDGAGGGRVACLHARRFPILCWEHGQETTQVESPLP